MDPSTIVEIVGYAASGLIVLSISQRSILRLRLLGLVGSLTFLIYSVFIAAYPVALVNTTVALIHLWYLRKLIRHKDEVFRVLHVLPTSRYLVDFLDHYADEIQGRFQPGFQYEPNEKQVTAFILRDMVPAGLFIGEETDEGVFEVKLDFVIPQYRDFKIGKYVYTPDGELLRGITAKAVSALASNREHAQYLERMGFAQSAGRPDRYEIILAA